MVRGGIGGRGRLYLSLGGARCACFVASFLPLVMGFYLHNMRSFRYYFVGARVLLRFLVG